MAAPSLCEHCLEVAGSIPFVAKQKAPRLRRRCLSYLVPTTGIELAMAAPSLCEHCLEVAGSIPFIAKQKAPPSETAVPFISGAHHWNRTSDGCAIALRA